MVLDKFTALAQVRKLMALADDERGNEAERTNARKQAERIRLKWGISDAELAEESDDEDFGATTGLGRRFAEGIRLGRLRQKRFDIISDAIKQTVQSFDNLTPEGRLEGIDKLYRHVYHELKGDGSGWFPPRLSDLRDEAILVVYEASVERRKQNGSWDDDPHSYCRTSAMEATKLHTDMRINDIENAIKRAKQARRNRQRTEQAQREAEASD